MVVFPQVSDFARTTTPALLVVQAYPYVGAVVRFSRASRRSVALATRARRDCSSNRV
jgi:hypothetical protein